MLEIIVDSTCDLSQELMDYYNIRFVPQRIYLKDTEYLDKLTINPEDVYAAMKIGIKPMTSLPSPQDMLMMFRQCCERGNDLLFLSISSRLSGTYQLAASLQNKLLPQYPELKIEAVDTKSSSTAAGLIALQAAKLAAGGIDFDTVVSQVKELAEHVEHIFMIQDLYWLIRGGRLTRAEGFAGKLLNVKPVMHVKDGAVELLEKSRGRKKTLLFITDVLEERTKAFSDQTIGISHGSDADIAYELADIITARLGVKDIMINRIGAVLTSHLGVDGVGVFFFNRKPEFYMK